jgi:hypothetical protein
VGNCVSSTPLWSLAQGKLPCEFHIAKTNCKCNVPEEQPTIELVLQEMLYSCIVYLTMIIRSDYSDDRRNDYWILNLQGCIGKRLWPNLRYHTRIFLEWGGKSQTSVTTVDLWADISTRDLINTGEKFYQLHRRIRILTVDTIRNIHRKSPYTPCTVIYGD